MIDQTTIRQVQDATDIVEIIGQHVSLKRAGRNFLGLCPFHEEKTPSFSVSPTKSIFKCFGCGAGGSVFQFLMRKDRISFPEAVRSLAGQLGIPIAQRQTSPEDQRKIHLADINQWAASVFRKNLLHGDLGRAARQYLDTRGLSAQTQEQFKIGLALPGWDNLIRAATTAGHSSELLISAGLVTVSQSGRDPYDRFRNRLIFPIVDVAQRVVAFAGRVLEPDLDGKGAKYLNSPQSALFDKSSCLYGLNAARQAIIRKNQAIVVEGYTDCLMAHQNGIANVVATMGTALTSEHATILRRFCDRVVVVFDSDQAGRAAAERALDILLRPRIALSVARVPDDKDPCDYISKHGCEAFEQLIANADDALEYKWQLTREAQTNPSSPASKHRAIQEFLLAVARSAYFDGSDPVWRGLLLNHLAKLLSVPPAEVLAMVNQLKAQVPRSNSRATTSPDSPEKPQEPLTTFEKALRQLLQVLLNKPSYIKKVVAVLGPDDFTDPALGPVAREIFKWAADSDQPELAQLLVDNTDLEQADLITSLAQEGEQKGNFQDNLSGALDYISSHHQRHQLRQTAQALRNDQADLSDQQINQMLQQVQSQLRTHDQRNPGLRV